MEEKQRKFTVFPPYTLPAVTAVTDLIFSTNKGVQDLRVHLLQLCLSFTFLFPMSADFGPWLSRMFLFFL